MAGAKENQDEPGIPHGARKREAPPKNMGT